LLRNAVAPIVAPVAAVMLLCGLALMQANTLQRQIAIAQRIVADYQLPELPLAGQVQYPRGAAPRFTTRRRQMMTRLFSGSRRSAGSPRKVATKWQPRTSETTEARRRASLSR
jgi:hypothetical protein